jgi:shikimate kinase
MSDGPLRIVIAGFMGAGKTTVAVALGRLLDCRSIDLDDVITAREGRTPQRLIDDEGEAAFRDLETRALRDALADCSECVIALGGGAWTLERNRRLVDEHGCVAVWLDVPFDLCWQRITRHGEEDRPFARDRARAHDLFEARRPAYKLAGVRIRVAPGRGVAKIAAEILEETTRLSRPT